MTTEEIIETLEKSRKETAERIKVLQAFVDGKAVEERRISLDHTEWVDNNNPEWRWDKFDYRIKPESKYRPFANAEECIEEMKKHVPFSWVKDKYSFYPIEMFGANFRKECIKCCGIWFTPEKIFKDATFLDGTPFGVKIEEDKQ
jgi:hypothetical protein